ncbi:MAG: mechanosensitive ion channel family protein [bacterium]
MFWRDLGAELQRRLVSPEQLVGYFMKAIQLLIVVAAALLAYALAGAVIRRLLRRAHERRAKTLISLASSLAGYVIAFAALILILRILGVDYTAILAGAGVVGLAVGFGAQTLVRDFIAGFFLLLEDDISVGDVIVVGEVSGTVEEVGLRSTKVRAWDGTLFVLPNGELARFGNRNRGFMRALVTVDLAYGQDSARGMARAREVADAWYAEQAVLCLEPPFVQGLLELGESGVRIRVVVKTLPLRHWEVERELRLRLKAAFEAEGIDIPLPQQVVHLRGDRPKAG